MAEMGWKADIGLVLRFRLHPTQEFVIDAIHEVSRIKGRLEEQVDEEAISQEGTNVIDRSLRGIPVAPFFKHGPAMFERARVSCGGQCPV